jgi:outer membrane protein TolC
MQRDLSNLSQGVVLIAVLSGAGPAVIAAQQPDTAVARGVLRAAPVDSGRAIGPRLPLRAVIARTMTNSPDVARAAGTMQTARSAQRVALGAYLPSLTLNSLAGRTDQSLASATTVTPATSIGTAGTYGAGVMASIDVFTGGRRGAVRARTAAAAQAADAGLVQQRYATELTAKQAFYSVLRGHELVRVADEAVTVATRGLAYAQTRQGAGTALRSDVLRARLALSTARRQQLAASDTLATSAAELGRLVGANGPVDVDSTATLHPTPLALADSALVSLAVQEAPSVKNADAQSLASKAAFRASKTLYMPTIQAGAGYNWSNNGRVTGGLRQGWIVAVSTSFPLFDGFVREDSVTRAGVAADIAASTSSDTRRFARAEALRLLGALHVAEQDVTLTAEAVDVATQDLHDISVRYRSGIATILDQITSQANLIQAGLDQVSAQFNYQVARASLEALLGRDISGDGQ